MYILVTPSPYCGMPSGIKPVTKPGSSCAVPFTKLTTLTSHHAGAYSVLRSGLELHRDRQDSNAPTVLV
jgi:hypothetical protein